MKTLDLNADETRLLSEALECYSRKLLEFHTIMERCGLRVDDLNEELGATIVLQRRLTQP